MRLQTFLLPAAVLIAGIASAQTPVAVPIINQVFTNDTLECSPSGNCSSYGITGWICGPNTVLIKASASQYESAPPSGLYVAAIGNSGATGSIFQTLGTPVVANATYTLKVKVGARSDYPFTGYEAALVAGNVTLASGNKATPVGGQFATEIITYSSGASPPQLGQPLQIFVKSVGTGQVDVSTITLTVE